MHITDTYQINTNTKQEIEIMRLKNNEEKNRNRSWSSQAVLQRKLD